MSVFFWLCALACLGSLFIIGVELCRETWWDKQERWGKP